MQTNIFDDGTERTWSGVSLVDTARDHQSTHQQTWDSSLISPWQQVCRSSDEIRFTFHA
jgi:hypothetical protein